MEYALRKTTFPVYDFENLVNTNSRENIAEYEQNQPFDLQKLHKNSASVYTESIDEQTLLSLLGNNAIGTITVESEYGVIKLSLQSIEDEVQQRVRRLTSMISRKFTLYKYYSYVWSFSMVLLTTFLLLGLTNNIGPFTSIVGIIMSIVGMVGAYIDWKDNEKNVY